MGFIKDGTISGKLPNNANFAVHYPGYPSSTFRAIHTLGGIHSILKPQNLRAIHTLGGIHSILKARSAQSNDLELYFRPEDPYSHPAFGERKPCNNFLLKISKKKDSNGHEPQNNNRVSQCLSEEKECQNKSNNDKTEDKSQLSEEGEPKLRADIIAQVSDAYHFNGMVDYQHVLPIHADVAQRKKRTWEDMESHFDEDKEDLLMLVPPFFSMKNVPEKVVLKPCGILSSKKKQEGVVQQGGEMQMEIEPCLAIDFYIETFESARQCQVDFYRAYASVLLFSPATCSYKVAELNTLKNKSTLKLSLKPTANDADVPKKVDWEKKIPKGSEQRELQTAVCKLFDERPIWAKNSVAESLIDQGLECGDFMLKKLLFVAAYYFSNGPFLRLYIRKGYDPRKDPESRIYQRTDFRVPLSLRSYCDANVGTGLKHRWKDICSFRVFPYKCQTLLQLFELSDDYIQKEIRKPPQQETCTCATGWFSSSTLDRLRLRVAVRFIKVYPKTGAESLLKAVSERFEKSKRMLPSAKDPKPGQQLQQVRGGAKTLQQDEEPVDNEDQEELNIDGEEEEEEEEEDIDGENVEEEFDPDDDNNFSQQPSLYDDDENVSRSYLQELFGSFPSSGRQGADNSEGEYEIYDEEDDDDDDFL